MHFIATLPIHEMFLSDEGEIVEDDVEHVVETAASLAKKVKVSPRTMQRELQYLQRINRLKHIGGDFGGEWEVIT